MSESIRKAPAFLACHGKEAYSTPQLAARVAKRRNTSKQFRSKTPRNPLVAYRCQHCNMFHIGTSRKAIVSA